ncbi:PREDICTED: probable 28S ribosomal protein S23, mitochondrial [Nicrophorus vespilloides]|uniref:Small ribosomal subunit protein mS23 n=1 Tax=Nicrophorus vespilloides TaxID=110193 RepID=A0ABM1MBT9_NICVS|nr:PREDICTED: probable 28S ribosomal protein S23, mitochondrial [Nicrophorus vespilloides]
MASSRLEKIGTIYTRTRGLLQSGAMSWNDRPLWYDIYEAFPPKEEPRYDRPAPNMQVKEILYEEDIIRAKVHSHFKSVGTVNLRNNQTQTLTQKFIDCYNKLGAQYGNEADSQILFDETLDILKKERELKAIEASEDSSAGVNITTNFTEAKKQQAVNINVKDIFKD